MYQLHVCNQTTTTQHFAIR